MDNQLYLRRLSEIVLEIYAMSAMLGRASRAYSIGLRNCEHETEMTFLFCKHARLRIDKLAKEIHEHGYATGDEHLQHLAKRVSDCTIQSNVRFYIDRFLDADRKRLSSNNTT